VIIIDINIARLIVTLSPLQVAMFIVAQLVGASIGLLLFYGMLMPVGTPPPV
jgi:glycerol uptake facilitator-like aquaporin